MNKFLLSFLFITILTAACNNASKPDVTASPATATPVAAVAPPVTTIQWVDTVKHIGKVTEGEKVEIAYKFINTGTNPLVISNVMASCGCTIAEKPEAPIAPGKDGYIKASFNSQGRIGANHKTLTVYANTAEGTFPLQFDVEVVAKK